jgi:hypothetical protein
MVPVQNTTWSVIRVIALSVLFGCGGSDSATGPSGDLVVMTIAGQTHDAGSAPILTVTSLRGPTGATVTNIKPGEYVVRGTYSYNGAITGPATLELTFNGSFNYTPSNKHDQTVQAPTGSFEVSVKVDAWVTGAGNPRVCIFPGTQIAGSSADCVQLF